MARAKPTAWIHEARDPHGRWIAGAGQLKALADELHKAGKIDKATHNLTHRAIDRHTDLEKGLPESLMESGRAARLQHVAEQLRKDSVEARHRGDIKLAKQLSKTARAVETTHAAHTNTKRVVMKVVSKGGTPKPPAKKKTKPEVKLDEDEQKFVTRVRDMGIGKSVNFQGPPYSDELNVAIHRTDPKYLADKTKPYVVYGGNPPQDLGHFATPEEAAMAAINVRRAIRMNKPAPATTQPAKVEDKDLQIIQTNIANLQTLAKQLGWGNVDPKIIEAVGSQIRVWMTKHSDVPRLAKEEDKIRERLAELEIEALKYPYDSLERSKINHKRNRLIGQRIDIRKQIRDAYPEDLRRALAAARPNFGTGTVSPKRGILPGSPGRFIPAGWAALASSIPFYVQTSTADVRGSYDRVSRRIRMRKGDKRCALHELMHHLENSNPNLLAVQRRYFEHRMGKHDSVQPLNEIQHAVKYKEHEVAMKDKWAHVYIGRWYQGKAFEILSCGMEGLVYGEFELARRDPDHLNWVLGVLASV